LSVFADSSAVVKLYADEDAADEVRALGAVAVSVLCRVEVPAALWRKHRLGELDATDAQVLGAEFEADFYGDDREPPRFGVVAVTAGIVDDAARLCAVHGLRAYDAVQLASATAARLADPDLQAVAAFDRALRRAAAAEGFTLVPPSFPEGPSAG
jgi:predicted nucleic acid-binding protein